MENLEVCKRIFDPEEKVLWSDNAYVKYNALIDRKIFSILFKLILSISIYILICLGSYMYYIAKGYVFSGLEIVKTVIGLILLGPIVIVAFYIAITCFFSLGTTNRSLLKNTEYFVSNKRILSITLNDDGDRDVVSLKFPNIDFFFTELSKNKSFPIHNIYFKTNNLTDAELEDMFQVAIPLSDEKLKDLYKFQITKERWYKLHKIPSFILSWKNVKDKDRLLEILNTFGLIKKETNSFFLRLEHHLKVVEAHVPGYFS